MLYTSPLVPWTARVKPRTTTIAANCCTRSFPDGHCITDPASHTTSLAGQKSAGNVVYYDANCVTSTLLSQYTGPMAKTKIATLNLRIDPGVKEAVREAADKEHRSVANMVEMLIRRHCDHAGISIPEQSEMFPGKQNG